jgi:uracil-DNA glycosylase
VLNGIMSDGWTAALADQEDQLHELGRFLRSEVTAGRGYLPSGDNILRAFQAPLEDVKVLLVGQDPYPTPGHPIGLSFSVNPDVQPIPRSLQNIFLELRDDIGVAPPRTGDLSPWVKQGVMLLNRVLTVQPNKPNSHSGRGWEMITDAAVNHLANRKNQPLVAILWGSNARTLKPVLNNGNVHIIESVHPSPLSAQNGFFGSRPFSRTNKFLKESGVDEIDWSLP